MKEQCITFKNQNKTEGVIFMCLSSKLYQEKDLSFSFSFSLNLVEVEIQTPFKTGKRITYSRICSFKVFSIRMGCNWIHIICSAQTWIDPNPVIHLSAQIDAGNFGFLVISVAKGICFGTLGILEPGQVRTQWLT